MEITQTHKNIIRTSYSIGDQHIKLTKCLQRIITGLIFCSPCVRYLPTQDKFSMQRLVDKGLAVYKGERFFEDGIKGKNTKFVSLTEAGKALATFIQEKEK